MAGKLWRGLLPVALAALLPACATTRPGGAAAGTGSGEDHPLGSGSVEFVGFPADVLSTDFRIIPEEGTGVFATTSGERIENVDGFWWRQSQQWYKIPDHCHVTVTRIPNGLHLSPDCSKLGTRIQRLRGHPAKPDWFDDSGKTSHPTDYPF